MSKRRTAKMRCAAFPFQGCDYMIPPISHIRRTIMRRLLIATALVCAAAQTTQAQTPAAPAASIIEVGAQAPAFALPGATRYGVLKDPVQLSDFAGKTVVVAFFPKARTRGCTIQMRAYRD